MASALSTGVISTSRTMPGCGKPRRKDKLPEIFVLGDEYALVLLGERQ